MVRGRYHGKHDSFGNDGGLAGAAKKLSGRTMVRMSAIGCYDSFTQDIKKTLEIHTNITRSGERIDGAINHMLEHGWRLLHVGSEWSEDREGKTIHHTVAILGTA